MRRHEPNDPGASDFSDKEAEDEFVVIDESKQPKPLIRQIEEGVYNIKREDYDPSGALSEKRRSIVIGMDGLSGLSGSDEDDAFGDGKIEEASKYRSQSHFVSAEPKE